MPTRNLTDMKIREISGAYPLIAGVRAPDETFAYPWPVDVWDVVKHANNVSR